MTTEPARFATSVRSCWGIWPVPPASWSYSSLNDLEACPRRWMLSRAAYPELWEGSGYPPMPNTAALFGDVVHAALELLVRALVAADCESTGTAAAVAVLKQ
ncbi:MAG: PD-(D/E)XK nuclease family protein [Sciscionella sp.]